MELKIRKWGDNLYELKIPFWTWSSKKILAGTILKLQNEGKIITCIYYFWAGDRYLICTADKQGK